MIGETGERKSAVATPDGKSRKKKKKTLFLNSSGIFFLLQYRIYVTNSTTHSSPLEYTASPNRLPKFFNFFSTCHLCIFCSCVKPSVGIPSPKIIFQDVSSLLYTSSNLLVLIHVLSDCNVSHNAFDRMPTHAHNGH